MKYKKVIDSWTIDDINSLGFQEDEHLEHKSGVIRPDDLKKKLSIAASAFSNTEGGLFFIGVNKDKSIDGIENKIGNQSTRDWIDQIIQTEPICQYQIRQIPVAGKEPHKCVIIVQFFQSHSAPHMANDKKYYIRAGAHSVPASHFLVEAIRLRASFQKPRVLWRLVEHERKSRTIRLVLFTVEPQNAYNVEINFPKLPPAFASYRDHFPLKVPIINNQYPFQMDIDIWGLGEKLWGSENLRLELNYEDATGSHYFEELSIDKKHGLQPLEFGTNELAEIKKVLEKIERKLK